MIIEKKKKLFSVLKPYNAFNYGHYIFANQIKRSYDETTQFCPNVHTVLQKFWQAKL